MDLVEDLAEDIPPVPSSRPQRKGYVIGSGSLRPHPERSVVRHEAVDDPNEETAPVPRDAGRSHGGSRGSSRGRGVGRPRDMPGAVTGQRQHGLGPCAGFQPEQERQPAVAGRPAESYDPVANDVGRSGGSRTSSRGGRGGRERREGHGQRGGMETCRSGGVEGVATSRT